jgi:glucosylceramidase
VAWHCYAGDVSAQQRVHDQHPDKETWFTECSGGAWAPSWSDDLKWFVGTLIIGSTRGWARGVLLWNLALDENHGPHTGGCGNCRGVVTINSTTGIVTHNVEYFALAHASKFVRPGARRIASTTDANGLQSVAFQNEDDGSNILIVLNPATAARAFAVHDGASFFRYTLAAGSVVTLSW